MKNLKIKVNIFAYAADLEKPKSGYQIHAINFAKALNKYTDVCFLPSNPQPVLINKDIELKQMIARNNQLSLKDISISINYGDELLKFSGKQRIGFTVFEKTLFNVHELNVLSQLDYIWVPSQWAKDVLIKNGLKKQNIVIVPEGVDERVFKPGNLSLAEFAGNKAFKFLSIGKYEKRKGQQELLISFMEEFGNDPAIQLILVMFNSFVPGYNLFVQKMRKMFMDKGFNNIIILDHIAEKELPSLYASCDAFVLPTRAEGWGLPIIEAAASGLPIITTYYSGHTEYLNRDDIYEIEISNYEDIYDGVFYFDKGRDGQWAVINKESLKKQMRTVYDNQAAAKQRGLLLSEKIRKEWTWDKAALKAKTELEKINNG